MENVIIRLLKTNQELINSVEHYINNTINTDSIKKKGGLSYNYDFLFKDNDNNEYHGEVKKNDNYITNIFKLPEILQIMGSNLKINSVMKHIIKKSHEIMTNLPVDAYKNYDRIKDEYKERIDIFRNISLAKYSDLVKSIKANDIDKYYSLLDIRYINQTFDNFINSVLYEIPEKDIETFIYYIVGRVYEQITKTFFLVNIMPTINENKRHIQIFLNQMSKFEYLGRYEIKNRSILIYTDKYVIECYFTFRNGKLKRNPAVQIKLRLNEVNFNNINDVLYISEPIDIFY